MFLVSPLSALVLPDGTAVEEIANPTGGLFTTDPSFKIESKYSPYMRNVIIDDSGIQGIKGFVALGSTRVLQSVTGIFPFNRETGQTSFLVTDSSVTLETSDFTSWTFVSSGSNTGTLLVWLQVRNKMWGFNGVDAPITWDGSIKQTLDGTKGTPNVPKFRYGQYYQDRVWGFNTTAGASDLVFSAITTTDAVIINPDDSRAWPVTNNLKIGQGDGEIGTALWVNGQLRCGKERSQYTIYGTNVSNYFARKDVSNSVGVVSNESVVNLDASTYYLSRDGIYRNEERISDLIIPDVEAIDKGTSKIVTDSWETQNDFGSKGNFFGTTATPTGLLQPITKGYGVSGGAGGGLERVFPTGILGTAVDDPPPLIPGTTFFGPVQLQFEAGTNNGIDSYSRLLVDRLIWAYSPVGGCDLNFASITIQNNHTGQSMKAQLGMNAGNSTLIAFFTTSSLISPVFDGYNLLNSTLSVKVEGCGLDISDLSDNGGIHFINSTTAQYISQVTTISMVTAWGNFDSDNNTNGGVNLFFLRSSTSVVNISTKIWSAVTPGSIINEPTINNFVQWASTTMSVSTAVAVTNIDNVEINHIEGSGSKNRAFAIDWKNRYWLAVSTENSNFKLVYLKSRITNPEPNAWMPIEGYNMGCFARSGNVFYGGSSSTGTVYRLDFGTNYDGQKIQFIYDTPDMTLNSNFASKNILKYLLDAQKDTNLTLSLGTSIDFGLYSFKSIPLNGSGRSTVVVKGVTNPAKTIRVRLTHNQLDKAFTINNFSVLYQGTDILESK